MYASQLRWLEEGLRNAISASLPCQWGQQAREGGFVTAGMFVQWRLWYYASMGFLIQAVLAGCIFFVPLIVDSMFTGDLCFRNLERAPPLWRLSIMMKNYHQ